ncbi:hypothetical protein NPIL_650541 [Nephila pilipes]|uniref:Uncharacterized protein n=1 Tax=Nephila pilipes TaxID=299642 RepID=A0A8X6Q7M4_NEPPI|nr:hypothetical protein NPIL_650541 [Nephila pilipes]
MFTSDEIKERNKLLNRSVLGQPSSSHSFICSRKTDSFSLIHPLLLQDLKKTFLTWSRPCYWVARSNRRAGMSLHKSMTYACSCSVPSMVGRGGVKNRVSRQLYLSSI